MDETYIDVSANADVDFGQTKFSTLTGPLTILSLGPFSYATRPNLTSKRRNLIVEDTLFGDN